jgi:aspartyl-tRNA(Asn)/glutamyl-tRNA(Gln) amidotransferase subunit C
MEVNKELIAKLAHLSRLEFSEESGEAMAKDLNKIVDWMQSLNEVDTEGVEPLIHMSSEMNVLRRDVTEEPLAHDLALKSAPRKDSNYFRVPKVME